MDGPASSMTMSWDDTDVAKAYESLPAVESESTYWSMQDLHCFQRALKRLFPGMSGPCYWVDETVDERILHYGQACITHKWNRVFSGSRILQRISPAHCYQYNEFGDKKEKWKKNENENNENENENEKRVSSANRFWSAGRFTPPSNLNIGTVTTLP